MNTSINFSWWLRKQEINLLNKEFDYKFQKYNIYTNDEIISKLKNLEKQTKWEQKDKRINFYNEIKYLEKLLNLNNYYKNQNILSFKERKYILLFYLYIGYINYNGYYGKKYKPFFKNEESIKWFLFKNGVYTNHYKWDFNQSDRDIDILIDKDNEKYLEDVYKILRNFSTERLIEKSFEEKPLKKIILKKENYPKKISKTLLINYYKKEFPFYVDKEKINDTKRENK